LIVLNATIEEIGLKQNKILYLVRHAKSSWRLPDLSDRSRPLNKRGQKDAPRMGERLKHRSAHPKLIVTSPANRAQSTAALIAGELGIPHANIAIAEQIYGASPAGLIELLRNLGNQHEQVMLVGHNPAMTDLVNQLAGYCTDNLPTCAIATLELASDDWHDLGNIAAELVDLDYPKKSQPPAP
jgi:phosphohistidine phosphatase